MAIITFFQNMLTKHRAWYERLALVLMNHYKSTLLEKEEKMRDAVQVCIDGLLDEDTHLSESVGASKLALIANDDLCSRLTVYRPALSRRLTRLENKLNLPSDERHISHAELLKCHTRELTALRVPENAGQPKALARADSERRDREVSLGMGDGDVVSGGGIQQVGKSVWVGREAEVTVEGWVLEWWEKRGYKGCVKRLS